VSGFSNEAFRLKLGEISQPTRSPLGFHIVRVNEKTTEIQKEFRDAKPQIQTILDKQKRKAALDKDIARLKKRYKVIMISK
jgi:parvulin-like peptidyl-prolyl isomerase